MPTLYVHLFQVLLEPYSRAYYYGPERESKRYEQEPIHPEYKFTDIKAMCEQPYPGRLSYIETIFI